MASAQVIYIYNDFDMKHYILVIFFLFSDIGTGTQNEDVAQDTLCESNSKWLKCTF